MRYHYKLKRTFGRMPSIEDIFGKENLMPALIIGIILIIAALVPEFVLLVLVLVAVFLILIGLLNFLKDKDLLALIVMIVGIVALLLLLSRYYNFF